MLAKLQWDPLFDTMGNRLPNRFIKHDKKSSDRYVTAIGELARGRRPGRVRSVPRGPRLHTTTASAGDRIPQGERLPQARRPGFLHAQRAAPVSPGPDGRDHERPEADVVFVAHTVLEDIGTFRDLWAYIPLAEPLDARYWRIPPAEVPRSEDEIIEWLYVWWEQIDTWIKEHKAEEMVISG